MKKILYKLFIAVLTMMPVAIVASCSDEPESEPDNTLYVNGVPCVVYPEYRYNKLSIWGPFSYLYATGLADGDTSNTVNPYLTVNLEILTASIYKGNSLTVVWGSEFFIRNHRRYYPTQRGEIKVVDMDDQSITLRFDNYEAASDSNEMLTINGLMKCKIEDHRTQW